MPEAASAQPVRLTVQVSGRVQMVGYRLFTERAVRRLGGIHGTVRNLANGDVQVIAEGRRADLEALLEQLKEGPPHALVRGAVVDWGEASGEFGAFGTVY